ncbi:hypothetical protein Aph01nite_80970 [Acrocarpospora phusangensis]|uniref:Uncharacterized protein n=1 Tax=Acrocarpospora phusangensis TaxID=1070424 RepID=A0A919QPC6_9ACTN|nr:hypothetical protein [Acrocarpospora phusangensis]GIH29787.1 hypothetical protein Aph01nite_80970 [Acrocarpospora phusangensis]
MTAERVEHITPVRWPGPHFGLSPGDCLVRVDDVHLTLAEAVTMVRRLSQHDRGLCAEIVEHCLIKAETLGDTEPLTEVELRAAAETVRQGIGLRDTAATLAWVAETGMSGGQFEDYIAAIARRLRFRRRKSAELAAAYLDAHRPDFDQVRALWVISSHPINGELLRGLGGLLGCAEASVTLGEHRAHALPAPLRHAPRDTLVGPVRHGDAYLTGLVLERRPAVADSATLRAAGSAAFAEWLAERRDRASIEWHWH